MSCIQVGVKKSDFAPRWSEKVMSLCVVIPVLVQPKKGVVGISSLCGLRWELENAGKYLVFTVGVLIGGSV